MAPNPIETIVKRDAEKIEEIKSKEGVVISGMSGLYPECRSVQELSDILYNKINPIKANSTRWKYSHPEVAQCTGMVPDLDRFDAQFFKVHYRLGYVMDTMGRKILEQVYQAIYDAGISPTELSGKKVGVYIGTCTSETEKTCFYDPGFRTGFGVMGCSKTMFANRISYWLNAKGPSMSIDQACCSSLAALEQAYLAIKRGECEAAIVGGTNLCLHPQTAIQYARTITISPDGRTKSFDQHADGCGISEAINVLFLQKAKDALRVYADVLYAKSEYSGLVQTAIGPRFGFYRDSRIMANFLGKFYEEAGLPPRIVEYVEAFGSADFDADKLELDIIDEVFCNNREKPLLVGSVMSNIGYSEGASGISAITKVLLGYRTGQLAGNLHCNTPRQDVQAIQDGRLRVLTDHAQFGRSYAAVNGISTTGVNAHVLLRGRNKPKELSHYKCDIPRLVTLTGRHDSAVKKIIEDLKSRDIDPEELALLYNIYKTNISGHMSRGFVILDTNENQKTVGLCEKVNYYDDCTRPLWFVYSGMGSQWVGMGAQLMRIPIFASAIQRCHEALAPKGINIVDILTSRDKSTFDNILNSFVGIAAIQIGLTDIFLALNIVPDKIIGHSVGELGCAYADGCLTAEEMILSAYSRGLVSVQTAFIRGSMAAVGVGYQQISKMCPPEIEVACHNGPESSTISGPADVMKEFVGQLTAKGIFAKEVPCSNIAYHSRYIAEAGPGLLKHLKEVIKTPKPRSERWVSTSVPQDRWNEPIAKLSSAEYHTNNLLNPVLFEETAALIPSNAVLVEIAPHGLLQAILKRSLPDSCCNIAPTRRGHPDNAYLVLEAVGKLYMEGYKPKVEVLYPKVEFPVSSSTPMLSHTIQWAHEEPWTLPLYSSADTKTAASHNFVLNVYDEENSYLRGHVVQDKILFPFAASLVAVWDTLAMFLNVPKKQISVQFIDLHLYAQPVLHDQRQLRLSVSLQKGTGRFEVLDGNSNVITGYIIVDNEVIVPRTSKEINENVTVNLTGEDVYALLNIKNYTYSGEFRSIHSVNSLMTEALILWRDNWVTFLDGMLQLNALRHAHEGVSVARQIRRLRINVPEHFKHVINFDGHTVIKAEVSDIYNYTSCGGTVIEHLKLRGLPLVVDDNFTLEPLQGDWNGECTMPEKENAEDNKAFLQSGCIGDISSLHWTHAPELQGNGIKVAVHYAGLNTVDVLKATGVIKFPKEDESINSGYGMDFSGVTQSGCRVMGVAARGACCSELRAAPELLWPVPAHWSLEDAATVPLAYLSAFYCFQTILTGTRIVDDTTQLRVLVHGGAGALGQAAISIALGLGYEVFTTVSVVAKKQFLLKLFPQLKDENIGNSRDHSFGDMVLSATNGEGCDIVISTVKGGLKNVSLQCCRGSGVTYDLCQLSQQEEYSFGMMNLVKERSYITLDITNVITNYNSKEMKMLHGMLGAGIARGYVRPLSRVTYEPRGAPRALRLLAAGAHRGRVLLQLHARRLRAQPRITCKPEEVHLILCDRSLLALHLADRLVNRGAKKLHLHYECPPRYVEYKQRYWNTRGAQVTVSSETFSDGGSELLENVNRRGTVGGIYIIATDDSAKSDEFVTTLSKLDSNSRKLCPYIRYFVILSCGEVQGAQICMDRVENQRPATQVTFNLNETCGAYEVPQGARELSASQWQSAVSAVERAVHSARPMLEARRGSVRAPSLLREVAEAADIILPENSLESDTLESLGIQSEKLEVVRNYLEVFHNVALSEETIKSLTVARIKHLEETLFEKQFRKIQGLETFFSNVDPDELLVGTDVVPLPTLSNSAINKNELDVSQTHLCIVPGLEGLYSRFSFLCERLKLPALVLQPGLDNPTETIPETAERYVQILTKKIRLGTNFYILGYEWGVAIALEVATILERKGMVGTVFCVGVEPEELNDLLEEELSEYKSEEELQLGVLEHMFKLMTGDKCAALEPVLRGCSSWDERVDACVRTLLGRVSHSAQYARALLQAALGRVEQARRYRPAVPALRSRVVLMRSPRAPHAPHTPHELRAPLAHAARDARCAAIINAHLDPKILQDFHEKNLCDTYLLSDDSICMGYIRNVK